MNDTTLADAQKKPTIAAAAIAFSIENDALSKALKVLSGVVDHAQVIQILGFIKCVLRKDTLLMIASNSEIEMHVEVPVTHNMPIDENKTTAFTLPCKKLFDISKTLAAKSYLKIEQNSNWTAVEVGKTVFKLASLPVDGFPQIENFAQTISFEMSEAELLWLLRRTGFAMAHQDVRFFLNGVLFKITPDAIETVATDGHRLARNAIAQTQSLSAGQYIIPKKTVQELSKHLQERDSLVKIDISQQHMCFRTEQMVLFSNLIDGDYPDYEKLLPKSFAHEAEIDINAFKGSLQKMITLANEKYHGAQFHFATDNLTLTTHNINHEEAKDEIAMQYGGDTLQVGLNIHYVLEVLQVAETESIHIGLHGSDQSIAFSEANSDNDSQFIIMPLTL
ncbi:MAG: DNA polymerase III subunit beta [Pseudomonadota bacterium]|nr:DNA polymerase III subunit beta [Pseudomonadota bacterium]